MRRGACFFIIYIHEAHPTDGWQVESNPRDGVEYADPRAWDDRRSLAETCVQRLGLTAPLLLDEMSNGAALAFGAWPERLYVIGTDGRIAYQGGKGPFGFDPPELERFLAERLRDA